MNIFEQAVRQKLRFTTAKGLLSVEDLYDLPLTTTSASAVSLDTVGIALTRLIRETETESLVVENKRANTSDALRLEIVKHIINHKKEEAALRADAKAKADKKATLLEIIARKKEADLEGKDVTDLEKMLAELS